ncbi:unnamed protein product [Prunus armeniaca]|uniref:AMMECR1 domain-containing protein n=1 Tax=Prunus armeniaca TaxID=36596 RepID=A0A6J5WC41_PRUAR|nr:unnamed protein product [Prunus armeniaca]
MVSATKEMVAYCFDTLLAHYNSEEPPAPAFDEGQHPLFVTWKKVVNGSETRLRGCIGTLEARSLMNGFKDYALNRYYNRSCTLHLDHFCIICSHMYTQ